MKMRKELNNKGFSLVELLIATMILGIVVVPLLHSFVVSAQTAARSGKLGDAVLASENIAEGVEAVTISELFNTSNISNYIPGASGQQLYKLEGGTYTPLAAGDTPSAPSHLGMQVQAGSSVFNAMVTLDPDVYSTEDDDGLNDMLLADYSNMDAAFVQTRDGDDPDLIAWSNFKVKADTRYGMLWDEASAEPVRTMTLTIDEYKPAVADEQPEAVPAASTLQKVSAKLELDYAYTFRYTEVDEETQESTTETDTIAADTITYELIPQGFSVAGNSPLPNLYLIYYPLYETDSVTNDIIRIENKVALPFKIFLVKQRDSDLRCELQYHASLQQYVPAGTDSGNYAVVYSNIREAFTNRDTQLVGVDYRIYRGNYFSVAGEFGGTEGDLVSKSARDRIFKTTVEIYDSADTTFTTPIHTFHSTKLQ